MSKRIVQAARSMVGAIDSLAICVMLLVMSVSLNVLQAQRLRAAPPGNPVRGTQLAAVEVTTVTGTRVPLSSLTGGRATVIYYYSETCGWCVRNLANARALREGTRDRFSFVALTNSRPARSRHEVLSPDFTGVISDAARRALKLSGTPQTLLVAADGTVIGSWRGAFSGQVAVEVERHFGVSLPGVAAAAAQ